VWGIQEITGDAVVIRVIARTAPLRQWEVTRELRERLKAAVAVPGGAAPATLAEAPGPAEPGDPDEPAGAPEPGGEGTDPDDD
jgi:small conductance mechanosensitive channel